MSTDRQIKMDARSDAGLLVRRRLSRPNSVDPLASRQMIDRNETLMDLSHQTIGLVGLGYVGLPLAVEFGKKRPVIGFDIRARTHRASCAQGSDSTREVEPEDLAAAKHLTYTSSLDDLKSLRRLHRCRADPDRPGQPPRPHPARESLRDRRQGDESRGAVVIYEFDRLSRLHPQRLRPDPRAASGLRFNEDFFVGYSPERINPGDKEHRLPTIIKVTSGSTPEAADAVDALYAAIITAGTHKAASIEVAEAAKVIENTQRDLNIALMNELAIIFHKLGIDTHGGARGGRHQVELPALHSRASSAATASASIPTT